MAEAIPQRSPAAIVLAFKPAGLAVGKRSDRPARSMRAKQRVNRRFDPTVIAASDIAAGDDARAQARRPRFVTRPVPRPAPALASPARPLNTRAMHSGDCVFCRIIERTEPATVVFEDEATICFLPLPEGRLAEGHVLVVPKRHVTDIFEATNADLEVLILAVRRVADGLREVLGATGANVLNASGPNSDQSVFHLHFHVVPRWSDDELWTWPTGASAHRVSGDAAALLRDHFGRHR
jgi:histidine triad (HIT) family protein